MIVTKRNRVPDNAHRNALAFLVSEKFIAAALLGVEVYDLSKDNIYRVSFRKKHMREAIYRQCLEILEYM